MIAEQDTAVTAFDEMGWGWGGRWSTAKDWMHFSSNGPSLPALRTSQRNSAGLCLPANLGRKSGPQRPDDDDFLRIDWYAAQRIW